MKNTSNQSENQLFLGKETIASLSNAVKNQAEVAISCLPECYLAKEDLQISCLPECY